MDGLSETEPLLRPAQVQRKATDDIPVEGYLSVQDDTTRSRCSGLTYIGHHLTHISGFFCDTDAFDNVPDAKKQIGRH